MNQQYWISELKRIAIIVVAALVIGEITDHLALTLLISISVYLIWNLYNIYQLLKWLAIGKRINPPDSYGVWGDIFYLIHNLQKRHQRRKKRLIQLANRFQDATSAMPDGVVALGKRLEIEWFNQQAKQQLNLRPSTDIGVRIDNLVRQPEFVAQIKKRNMDSSVIIQSPADDRITLKIQFVSYAKKQWLMIISDVSQQHLIEQMRRDFIANVSHELRTPLTVINGFVETMIDAKEQALEPWSDSLVLMEQQSHRMRQIIDDLLLLSRLETNQSETSKVEIDVGSMLRTIVESASVMAEKKQQQINLECDDGMIIGIEKEIHSAFNNLVVNAIRYTPEKGAIDIRWISNKNENCFCVSDNGIGIAQKHIPRLTERFYRIDVGRSRESGGTGLGLAIVKHVLSRHDATLSIESQIGKGSTFCCHFPKVN